MLHNVNINVVTFTSFLVKRNLIIKYVILFTTQLNVCKPTIMSCMKCGTETWTLRTEERWLQAAECCFYISTESSRLLYGTSKGATKVITRKWKLGKQIQGRIICWNIYKRCHQKELPSNFYIINRYEHVIQDGQEECGFIFEDGTG